MYNIIVSVCPHTRRQHYRKHAALCGRMEIIMSYISEAPKQVPVIYEADVCVIGGSCTGVFAAVRAARLGARVVIVECQNSFGGVATNGLVCVWHTFNSTDGKQQVISGLSEEVLSRFDSTDHIIGNADSHFFNPTELKCELDRLLTDEKVKIYLHTYYAGISCDGDTIDAVFVENKDGRGAIKAKFFIDATGDGDLCRDLGIERFENPKMQPPSYVFLMQGNDDYLKRYVNNEGSDVVTHFMNLHTEEFGIERDWGWATEIPGLDNLKMRANTHVFNVNCGRAEDLTRAELIGRDKMRKVRDLLRKYGDPKETYSLVADCSYIGVRDTYHYKTKLQADSLELLMGHDYDDCILRGTYNVDAHDSKDGISFMQLDGTLIVEDTYGNITHRNWRAERGLPTDGPMPTFYRMPFRVLVGERYTNFIAAGRMINAEPSAFGALRVMVNLNQIGEASGVAAALAVEQGKSIQELDSVEVARKLSAGGSANLG